jgi:hypothetical protein
VSSPSQGLERCEGNKGAGSSVLRSLSHGDSSLSTRTHRYREPPGEQRRRGQPRSSRAHFAPTRGSRSDGWKAPRFAPGSRPSRGGLPRPQRSVRIVPQPNVQVFGPLVSTYRVVPTRCGPERVTWRCPGDDEPGLTAGVRTFACESPHPRLAICSRPARATISQGVEARVRSHPRAWPPTSQGCTSLRL